MESNLFHKSNYYIMQKIKFSLPAGAYMVQLIEDKQLIQTQRLLINSK